MKSARPPKEASALDQRQHDTDLFPGLLPVAPAGRGCRMRRDSFALMLAGEIRRECRAALFWSIVGLGVSCMIAMGLDVAGMLP